MKNIGVIISIKSEVPRIFKKYKFSDFENYRVYTINKDMKLILCLSGVGRINAGEKTENLLKNFNVDYILSIGTSGAKYENVKIGDIVIANKAKYNDETIQLDKNLYKLAESILSSKNTRNYLGIIQNFDTFIYSKQNIDKDIAAIDMESFHVAKTAVKFGVPTLIVRSVSDILSKSDPKFFPKLTLEYKLIKGYQKSRNSINNFFKEFYQM
jgi:adenosylhomocysteine nucleosidase